MSDKEGVQMRKYMKRWMIIAVVINLVLLAAACGARKDDVAIKVAGLKGPTSMGLVKVMEDSEKGESANRYEFTLAGSADEVTPKLVKGELDIAAVPANLASVLYNSTEGAVRLLAVNNLGVLYIVEKGESVSKIADLKGKTVYATGKGSTPEYALRYILQKNGIDPDRDLTIEFKSEPAEIAALLSSQNEGIAMLPQPYVAVAQSQNEGLRIAVDLNRAWDETGGGSHLVTGVIVARKDFIDKHPEAADRFIEEYRKSVEWVLADNEAAAQLIEKYGIVKAQVAVKALPYCNLTCITGDDMKAPVEGYLRSLYEQNPQAVGGKLPDADFYYISD